MQLRCAGVDVSFEGRPELAIDDAWKRTELLKVFMAEFSAMRAEITTMLSMQGQFLSFSIFLIGGSVALYMNKTGLDHFIVISIAFLMLGLIYEDVTMRIFREARYIEFQLKPNIENILCASGSEVRELFVILDWERYIRHEKHSRKIFILFGDMIRRAVYIVPSFLSFVVFWNNGCDANKKGGLCQDHVAPYFFVIIAVVVLFYVAYLATNFCVIIDIGDKKTEKCKP